MTEALARSRRMLFLLAMSCGVVAGQAAVGQAVTDAGARAPEFDAVSIRPSGPKSQRGSEGGPGSESPTLFRFHAATLQDLIAKAWNVDRFQILSASPLDKDAFDLDARLPEGATKEQFRSMLQGALAARFGLKTHLESREFSAYELVVAKSGLKLKEAADGGLDTPQGANSGGPCGRIGWPDVPPNLSTVAVTQSFKTGYELNCLAAQRESFATLVRLLPKQDGLPIVDTTGLRGKYSFHLEYAAALPNAGPDASAVAADVFTALKEQLGLQLRKRKHLFDVVVVESFNKMPNDN